MNKIKIGFLLSYACVASVSAAMITPALPIIRKEYHLTDTEMDWLISIFLIGYLIGQLVYAPIANSFGRLNALRIGLGLNLIGVLICVYAVHTMNYSLILFGRLIAALGSSSGLSCTFMLVHESLSKDAARSAISFIMLPVTVGLGLAVALGGIISEYSHWGDCFWLLFLHGIIMLFGTYLFKETLKQKTPFRLFKILGGYVSTLKSGNLILSSFIGGLYPAIVYCNSAAAPLIAHRSMGLSPSQYGYWNCFNMIGMFLSSFAVNYFLNHFKCNNIIKYSLLGIFACLVSLGLLIIAPEVNTPWFFLTTTLLFFAGGVLFPCTSLRATHATSDRANASAMMSFINVASALISVIILDYLPGSSLINFTLIISGFFVLSSIFFNIVKKFPTP